MRSTWSKPLRRFLEHSPFAISGGGRWNYEKENYLSARLLLDSSGANYLLLASLWVLLGKRGIDE